VFDARVRANGALSKISELQEYESSIRRLQGEIANTETAIATFQDAQNGNEGQLALWKGERARLSLSLNAMLVGRDEMNAQLHKILQPESAIARGSYYWGAIKVLPLLSAIIAMIAVIAVCVAFWVVDDKQSSYPDKTWLQAQIGQLTTALNALTTEAHRAEVACQAETDRANQLRVQAAFECCAAEEAASQNGTSAQRQNISRVEFGVVSRGNVNHPQFGRYSSTFPSPQPRFPDCGDVPSNHAVVYRHAVLFAKPFLHEPQIATIMSFVDGYRVFVEPMVTDVTRDGFTLVFTTNYKTLCSLALTWIAIDPSYHTNTFIHRVAVEGDEHGQEKRLALSCPATKVAGGITMANFDRYAPAQANSSVCLDGSDVLYSFGDWNPSGYRLYQQYTIMASSSPEFEVGTHTCTSMRCEKDVTFATPCPHVPQIVTFISHIDQYFIPNVNGMLRQLVDASNVRKDGFTLNQEYWHVSKAYAMGATWIAYCERE